VFEHNVVALVSSSLSGDYKGKRSSRLQVVNSIFCLIESVNFLIINLEFRLPYHFKQLYEKDFVKLNVFNSF
jgi:hypothetical protein